MKNIVITLAAVTLWMGAFGQSNTCKELFISEMIEGNAPNRALELFNPSDTTIDLSSFSIRLFQNGQLTPLIIPLSGTIPPKSTFVIAHPAAKPDIKAKADMLDAQMSFDGNDAIVLEKTGGTQIDKIGEIGVNPGNSGWFVPPNGSTKEQTLRRKEPVDRGETNWNQGKNQWTVHPKDSVSNLKQHQNICSNLSFPPTVLNTLPNGDQYIDDHIVVRFNPDYVNNVNVDNTNKRIGFVSNFVTNSAVNAISSLVGFNIGNLPCFKVHPRLTTSDTLSISRTGRTVKLLPYYATFGIILPDGTNDTVVVAQFDTAYPYVQSAALNHIYYLDQGANDPEYVNGNMSSLVSTTSYPDANINIEPAWDIARGSSNIRVGVFDSGINYAHSEFGDGTFSGSKVADGFDYFNNIPVSSVANPDSMGHGTAVAGIIGAIRNNNFGVPGIAGGDDLTGNSGVTLYDLKIFQQNDTSCFPKDFGAPMSMITQAIIDGALSSPTGYGLHVMNHSWGGPDNSLMEDAIRTSFENEVVMAVSSGNNEGPSPTNCIWASMPATYKDEWVMKVGANDTTGGRAEFSNCGWNLDYIAPGVHELYTSVDNNVNGFTNLLNWGPGQSCSGDIDGTSFAAPQVAGLSALMLSYVNNHLDKPNDLAPEDCEQMIQKFATDITSPANAGIGYDDETGYGRINAGATLQNLELPNHQVIHYSFSLAASNAILMTPNLFDFEGVVINDNYGGISNGNKLVKRYELTVTNNHTIPVDYQVVDGWKRDAQSNLPGLISKQGTLNSNVNRIPNEPDVILSSFNNTSATLTGYIYEIVKVDSVNNVITLGWYPFDLTDTAEFTYSLYVLHNSLIGIEEIERPDFNMFPNPANETITLSLSGSIDGNYSILMTDITGKTIRIIDEGRYLAENETRVFSVSDIVPGMYFISINTQNGITNKKLVISR
ncbi:MAG: hypothetical protein COB85_07735 [Bacteroidetes bacterium]|nr:MAG: hypothetical protein COB85_07735 [Bacteroidota bacterium]